MGTDQSKKLNVRGSITKIEQQKRNPKRFNIYVHDEYAFSVHEDVLISMRLLKGKEINLVEMKEILAEEERKKAERSAYHFLSFRPRTSKEMKDYLQSKEFDPETVEYIVNKLLKEGYIDDYQFALKWVHERLSLKKKGPLVLREELRQKGVATHIINEALEQVDQAEQIEACLQLAEKKWKQIQNRVLEPRVQRQKLIIFLQGRGFAFDVIQAVIHRMGES